MSATKSATVVRRHAKNQPAIKFFTGADLNINRKGPLRKGLLTPPKFKKGAFRVLHKIKDVEDYLGVSKSTIYRLIADGQFDVVHVLGSVRITSESLESYVTNHTSFGTAVSR